MYVGVGGGGQPEEEAWRGWGFTCDCEPSPPRTQPPPAVSPASRRSQIPDSAPAPLPSHRAAPAAGESERGAKSRLRGTGGSCSQRRGIGDPPEGASGTRQGAAGPGARGRTRAQRRAAEGLMARSGSRRPPRHAAQSPAGSGPPGPARLGSVRPPARAHSFACLGWVRPGSARCVVRGALSPGICRDPSSGREAAGGEAEGEGRGCACAPTSVCEGVSGPVCARGLRTREPDRGLPPLPRPLLRTARGGAASLRSGAVSLPARPYGLCV